MERRRRIDPRRGAAVGGNDRSGEGEPEAGAALVSTAGLIEPGESFEELGPMVDAAHQSVRRSTPTHILTAGRAVFD